MQPEGLLGIHLNTQYAFPAQLPGTLSPEQRHAVEALALCTGDLGGANHFTNSAASSGRIYWENKSGTS
ncbi:MAG TPA: hypothetical protein VK817_04525, partial [Trebonia sp.]|nr:hypothetical protein [Trebonia sp.]